MFRRQQEPLQQFPHTSSAFVRTTLSRATKCATCLSTNKTCNATQVPCIYSHVHKSSMKWLGSKKWPRITFRKSSQQLVQEQLLQH